MAVFKKSLTTGNVFRFSVAEVEPWLYLSGASVLGARLLQDLGISVVVSACPELPPLPLPDCIKAHHMLDIRDLPGEDITPYLSTVADIIAKVIPILKFNIKGRLGGLHFSRRYSFRLFNELNLSWL